MLVRTTCLIGCTALLLPSVALAQGVTTSGLHGLVAAQDGSPLPQASVVAVHLPSNTQYGWIKAEHAPA